MFVFFFSECFKLLHILSYIAAVYYILQVMINTQFHTSLLVWDLPSACYVPLA
jgi:hypothetical protein